MPEAKKTVIPLPPFQRDAQGRYTCVPYGRFGARYLVGDEAAYESLKPEYLWKIIGLTIGLALVVNAVAQLTEAAKLLQQAGPLLLGLTFTIAYVTLAQHTTRHLRIEKPRPKFLHTFRGLAYSADAALLWGIQIVCLAAAYFLILTLHPPWTPQTVLNALYATIFASVAAICGLMLIIGNRRVAVRR